ncbi:unnamed protein product [Paramecium sonneborni]|uniref:RNA polymerase Rpb2 domain-containing protein n=1 Tax=Paramecium sonneborni TaxID=65129 RepID=A0A8S1QIZ2_9CILI|nr:unnamed protein product [Paramecium sonneborni]
MFEDRFWRRRQRRNQIDLGNQKINKQKHLTTYWRSTESRNRKADFLGYIVHRLLNASLGKTDLDDGDHLGKKILKRHQNILMEEKVDEDKQTKPYLEYFTNPNPSTFCDC